MKITRNLSAGAAALIAALFLVGVSNRAARAGAPTNTVAKRVPWTDWRVVGSPDPPLPFAVERVFSKIKLTEPIFVVAEPGADRLFVIQGSQAVDRPSVILHTKDDPQSDQAEPFLVLSNRLVYSLTFHPGYRTNGYIYVFENGPSGQETRSNRIERFTVSLDGARRCDPASGQVIIEWPSAGHDGGGLVFGHDGMLYITSGDGTSDSDGWNTGQDITDLNGGVLRIDVDHPKAGMAYSIPSDNPFVREKDARGELWAYGLRNPWRLAVDDKTGQIWAGSNGQDLWESVNLVRRGENYGWSVYEGSHPFYLNRKLGPTPVVPPTIEHPHSEMRSLTGGVVYYGDRLPELNGVYVYGDYSTGRIWGGRHDGQRLVWHKELARTQLKITSFGADQRGDLLITDHAGAIYRLVPKIPPPTPPPPFPARLSETGLFTSTKDLQPSPGVIPYSVNASGWADGAVAQRWLALPGESRMTYAASGGFELPEGAVVAQTLSIEQEAGRPGSRRRIETRLLTRQEGQWAGYSYRWNEAQTDATLVAAQGADETLAITNTASPGAVRRQPWRVPSRAECMVCHARAANFLLSVTAPQLSLTNDVSGTATNQLRSLEQAGLFAEALPSDLSSAQTLANPYDPSLPAEARARTYLHVNCSGCHVAAGGGNSKMELGASTPLDKMSVVGARPQHDTFGIDNAMLVFPGDPGRSIIYERLSRRGRGQMPPLVVATSDKNAVALFREWISSLRSADNYIRAWTMDDLRLSLTQLGAGRSLESGKAVFTSAGCVQCHKFGADGGSVGPDLTAVASRLSPQDILESIITPSKVIAEGYAATEIETRSGETYSGRVASEDNTTLVLQPATATADSVAIRKADIKTRALSKISNMPTGLANTLQRDQILDLIAYLEVVPARAREAGGAANRP